MPELWVANAGRLRYADGVALQERVRERRQSGEIPDTLLFVEHDPVYTKGRRSEPGHLPMGEEWYRMQGVEVEETDRGGQVTYHGPGQLVGYPIMGIDDVLVYVRTMERGLIAALADEQVVAEVRQGLTGVWVEDRKIGSIGVHISRGVTTHGFAINVDNDLQPFEWIVPCGIENVRMTSLRNERGRSPFVAPEPTGFEGSALVQQTGSVPLMKCFRKRVAWRFAEAYGLRQRLVSLERLLEAPVASSV
jgi:lipoyl(octanoyl) transferase